MGRRVRVVYDDGKWYPARITAWDADPANAEPFTLEVYLLPQRNCLTSRFAKVNSHTNPSTYSLYE